MSLLDKIKGIFRVTEEDEDLQRTQMLLHRNRIMRLESSKERKKELQKLYMISGHTESLREIEKELARKEEAMRREEDFMDGLGMDGNGRDFGR